MDVNNLISSLIDYRAAACSYNNQIQALQARVAGLENQVSLCFKSNVYVLKAFSCYIMKLKFNKIKFALPFICFLCILSSSSMKSSLPLP